MGPKVITAIVPLLSREAAGPFQTPRSMLRTASMVPFIGAFGILLTAEIKSLTAAG